MKSLKIAALGVAALGFAALPVAGAFAEAMDTASVSKHIDAIEITVNSSCTLGTMTDGAYDAKTGADTDDTDHVHGDYDNPKTSGTPEALGTWTENTNATGLASGERTDTLAVTMQPGTAEDNIGQTVLTVRCNNAAGYELKAAAATKNLEKSGSSAVIPGAAAADGTSYWNFMLSDATENGMTIVDTYETAGEVPTTATKIAGKTASGNIDDGESVTVTYGAGIAMDQESGTYTGSVTYTLSQL